MDEQLIKNVAHRIPFELADLVTVEAGRKNSLTLSQAEGCKMTVFAIDAGEGMQSHAAPGDAMAFVLEGTARITIDGVENEVSAGKAIVMPKGIPHAVLGITAFKMLLVVVL